MEVDTIVVAPVLMCQTLCNYQVCETIVPLNCLNAWAVVVSVKQLTGYSDY